MKEIPLTNHRSGDVIASGEPTDYVYTEAEQAAFNEGRQARPKGVTTSTRPT
jgi:hypothetical protein